MDGYMQKRIGYFVNNFEPDREALSKETQTLFNHFAKMESYDVFIHNISSRPHIKYSKSHVSYYDKFLPLGFFYTRYLQNRLHIIHIFGSLTGRIYLNILNKHPLIITNSSAIDKTRIADCKKKWGKIDKVVVECEQQKKEIEEYGIPSKNISLIYPGVNLTKYNFKEPEGAFKILFASSPISLDQEGIRKRGVNLILQAAKICPEIQFILLWRGKHYKQLKTKLENIALNNVSVINKIVPNMNEYYDKVHCAIVPATDKNDCKPCPLSIVECLSSGKPVIVSRLVGISELVQRENCGLIFKPNLEDLLDKISTIKINYYIFQKHARAIAEKYFSKENYVKRYEELYSSFWS